MLRNENFDTFYGLRASSGICDRRIRHWRRKRRRACTLITRKKCALEKKNTVDRVDPGSGRGQGVEVKEEPVEIARGGRRGDLCV